MKYTNKYGLPPFLVDALAHSDYDAGDSIGITTLIDSPRIRHLRRMHNSELTKDISEMHNLFFGLAIHKYLEGASGVISEKRFRVWMRGVEISGQPDVIDVENKTIWDIKTAKAISASYGPKASWERQLNCYRSLVAHADIEIDKLKVLVVYKDWSIGEKAFQERINNSYPQSPYGIINIPVWSLLDASEYIDERISAHTELKLPECTPEERWEKPAKYAVMSGSKYKAERLLDTDEEARAWMESHQNIRNMYVVQRSAEWKRCKDYCDVSKWCEQYQTFIA
jgi:hypothetical protein